MTAEARAEGVPVPFAGTLTFDRFVAVQKALLPRWSHPLVTGACIMWVLSSGSATTAWYEPAMLVTSVPIAGAIVILIWGATRFTYRRQWRRMIALHGALSGAVGPAGIQWKTDISEINFSWDKIVKARVVDDMVLLHYAPRCACISRASSSRTSRAGKPSSR
jgi:hypothetical protein